MPYPKSDLTGTVVAITGASAGIGRATALMLGEAGANVVLGARRPDRFGRLDTLVANAVVGMYGGIEDGTDEEIERVLEINLTATVWSVRAAVPELRRNGGGDIIIVASVAGLRGDANEAVYAPTKLGQVGLAGALDRELRKDGIRVTVLCPAGVTTEFALGTGRTEGDPALDAFLQPEDIAFQVLTCSSSHAACAAPWGASARPAVRRRPPRGAEPQRRGRPAAATAARPRAPS